MSAGELWRGVTISAVIAVAFGYIGYHVISYALQMVGLFGAGLGVDAESREIYAATHRWVHLFAAACGLAIGWFYHRGQRLFFSLVLAAILACGGYGIINMYGFTGKNRVTVAAVKDAKRAGAEREYQNARIDLQRQIEWAERTAAQEDGREKRRLLAYIDEKRKELSALKVPIPDADTVMSDTHSHSLAALTATDANTWMLLLPLILAILVFCAESLSFIIVGHMVSGIVGLFAAYLATARKPAVAGNSDVNSNSDGGGNTGNSNKDTNVVPLKPAEPSTPAIRAEPVAATPVVERPKSATPQRSVTPVASAPWNDRDVDAYLSQLPLMAVRPTWRQIGAMTGWDYTTLFKRGQRLTGQSKGKRVLGQHRQQHRQEHRNAYPN